MNRCPYDLVVPRKVHQGEDMRRWVYQPHPPQEAQGTADAGTDPAKAQRHQIHRSIPRRTRFRCPEGPYGSVHPHHRHCLAMVNIVYNIKRLFTLKRLQQT